MFFFETRCISYNIVKGPLCRWKGRVTPRKGWVEGPQRWTYWRITTKRSSENWGKLMPFGGGGRGLIRACAGIGHVGQLRCLFVLFVSSRPTAGNSSPVFTGLHTQVCSSPGKTWLDFQAVRSKVKVKRPRRALKYCALDRSWTAEGL